jgi:hypothetical protein
MLEQKISVGVRALDIASTLSFEKRSVVSLLLYCPSSTRELVKQTTKRGVVRYNSKYEKKRIASFKVPVVQE